MGAYGWKATIGFIGPPRTNETVLHESFELAPAGISWCWSVMGLPEFGNYEFAQALESAALCAKELAARKVDIIVLGGVPLLTAREPGFHLEMQAQLSEAIGNAVPVTSDVACFLGAARAMGLKRLALCSIYQRFIQDNFKRHLAAYGFETATDVGLEYKLADCMTKSEMDTAYVAASGAWQQDESVDGMILACPQWPVIHNVPKVEQQMNGKPVIAHMPAVMWGALSQIGVEAARPGFGHLLEQWPAWPSEMKLVEQEATHGD
jgi:maleate cis-trans isomerase